MSSIKTRELIGPALDWAVLRARGYKVKEATHLLHNHNKKPGNTYHPSTNGTQANVLIEKHEISTIHRDKAWGNERWSARIYASNTTAEGPTALIAAMRAFVLSVMGEEIEIPEELQ